MPRPNLAITPVAAAQNQKEVTINDAIDALDLPHLGPGTHCPRCANRIKKVETSGRARDRCTPCQMWGSVRGEGTEATDRVLRLEERCPYHVGLRESLAV